MEYNRKTLSALVLGLFFAKTVFLMILTNMFIVPNMDNVNTINDLPCAIVQSDIKTNTALANVDKGSFGTIVRSADTVNSQMNVNKNIVACVMDSTAINNAILQIYNFQIPALITFFLFEIWPYLIALGAIRLFFSGF